MSEIQLNADLEAQLQEDICRFVKDPRGFVDYAYPWGEEGTDLHDETGPDEWQAQILDDIGHALKHGWVMNQGEKIDCTAGIYVSVSSGHGVGKSALFAMLDQWFMSCHPNPQIVTTANTQNQLNDKTWREQAKWHKLLINRHWFKWSATKFRCLANPELWFSSAVPWSANNPEAFAGTHEKYVFVKFDEGSGIVDIIWETTEGAFTDSKGIKIWIVFGNPTQTTGRFAQCFKKERKRWIKYKIDSRTSNRTDKKLIQHWVDTYGEDSDFVRVRVRGEFPRAGTKQYIPSDIVEAAAGRIIHPSRYIDMPKIMGVDIARFGDDQTVFVKRQGLALYGLEKFRGLNTQTCAGYIAQRIQEWEPDAVFLDMGNIGASVWDLLDEWGYDVTGVWFQSPADDPTLYFNKRTEMWGKMKLSLENGLCIPDDQELIDDLTGPFIGFSSKEQFQLESAEDMKGKERNLASPDNAMATALTYAYPVAHKQKKYAKRGQNQQGKTDYNPFDEKSRQPGNQQTSKTNYDVFGK